MGPSRLTCSRKDRTPSILPSGYNLVMSAPLLLLVAATSSVGFAQSEAFTKQDRLNDYLQRTYSWERMTMLGADTLLDQFVFRNPHEWAGHASDFALRYSSSFGRRVVRNTIEMTAGIAFGEDTRFRPSGQSSLLRRIEFAVAGSVVAWDHHGHRQFA